MIGFENLKEQRRKEAKITFIHMHRRTVFYSKALTSGCYYTKYLLLYIFKVVC